MAEMEDAPGLGPGELMLVGVRVPSPAPISSLRTVMRGWAIMDTVLRSIGGIAEDGPASTASSIAVSSASRLLGSVISDWGKQCFRTFSHSRPRSEASFSSWPSY